MKITKFGHCCLLIEEKDLTILTDPGAYSTKQTEVKNVDIILITHEHADHVHVDSLKIVLKNNPTAEIITNSSVAKILEKQNIKSVVTIVAHGQSVKRKDVEIAGFGTEHAYIYSTITPVENTGYFVGGKLFYPGDAFFDPKKPVDILALPVAGPWMKISEAVDYAKKVKPNVCFPVHDGMFIEGRGMVAHKIPESALALVGIKFISMKEGDVKEF